CTGPQPHPQIDAKVNLDLDAPSPARSLDQPLIARASPVANAETTHDPQLVETVVRSGAGPVLRFHTNSKDLFLLGSSQRKNAVRRHSRQHLGEVEIVTEPGAGLLFAIPYLRYETAVRPHLFAQRSDQVSVLCKALGKDGAGAIKSGSHIGHLVFSIDEAGRRHCGIILRPRQ